MRKKRTTRVSMGAANRNTLILLDAARRQWDLLGWYGMRTMRGPMNAAFLQRNLVRLTLPGRGQRARLVTHVRLSCDSTVGLRLPRRK